MGDAELNVSLECSAEAGGGTNFRVVCDRACAKARGSGVGRAEERMVLACQRSLRNQENEESSVQEAEK